MLELPEEQFTYIGRPWDSFSGRLEAVFTELDKTDGQFTLVDVGSCNGYFCLQIAHKYPKSSIIGVEGSVGIGNGSVGTSSPVDICETKAVCTHLRWVKELQLTNCHLAPDVWSYDTICRLVREKFCVDHLLLLSVVHHVDVFSREHNMYWEAGLTHLEGSLDVTAQLLKLATVSIVELPDRPWMAHVYDVYKSQHNFLLAACRRAFGPEGKAQWSLEAVVFENGLNVKNIKTRNKSRQLKKVRNECTFTYRHNQFLKALCIAIPGTVRERSLSYVRRIFLSPVM